MVEKNTQKEQSEARLLIIVQVTDSVWSIIQFALSGEGHGKATKRTVQATIIATFTRSARSWRMRMGRGRVAAGRVRLSNWESSGGMLLVPYVPDCQSDSTFNQDFQKT